MTANTSVGPFTEVQSPPTPVPDIAISVRNVSKMYSRYAELAARFRGEVEDIDQVVQRTLHAWTLVRSAVADQAVFWMRWP